ncbi:MAG: PEP/pyruvate-binding domain-containing protein [Porticoccaceae bacterium]
MTMLFDFNDPKNLDKGLVGGKGIHLSRLAQAGFPVPPGFIITTSAYENFLEDNELHDRITDKLNSIDYADADQLESISSDIRELITNGMIGAALKEEIAKAYGTLGEGRFVAVRSSGTAEDLSDASFAGQHDTYLDIRGTDAVLDAVKRCWASLWTGRAVAYRHKSGYDRGTIGIAVVVQAMVSSEVSGVMFTANPMSGAVDEFVVNASWGLGEAIVSGIVTPDLFVINRDNLNVRRRTLGSKEIKIVRDPDSAYGTVELEVSQDDSKRLCLDDAQLSKLGSLGARVMEYYEGFPQDIEWALSEGEFYLLQSRDITGIEFCWDEDLDNWQQIEKDDETIWTRAWADAVWTGAITPLFYSYRAESAQMFRAEVEKVWGLEGYGSTRVFKYHKAHAYYNSKVEYISHANILHPRWRRGELLDFMPNKWKKDIQNEPFSWLNILKILARIGLYKKSDLPWNHFDAFYKRFYGEAEKANGLTKEEIMRLTDNALKKYAISRVRGETWWVHAQWNPIFFYAPIAVGIFRIMLEDWADVDDPSIFADLMTGLPEHSSAIKESMTLSAFAQEIKSSPFLLDLFEKHPGSAFFEEIKKHDTAKEFSKKYTAFIKEYGHRGQADRDIYFDRRADNPGLDYTSIKSMIDSDPQAAEQKAQAVIDRRISLAEQMVEKMRKKPFGDLRAQAFTVLHEWLLKFWVYRDDQRAFNDRFNYGQKLSFTEIGRRLVERGVFSRPDDFYFFSMDELFHIFDTSKLTRLDAAKLAARRRNHERFHSEYDPPKYMVGDTFADLDAENDQSDNPNLLRGMATSRGKITGVARVIASQKDIGKVKEGEILVTAATDPGWTPVFMVISGLVLETGGMLAHGSLLSREYGIPAVQVSKAMKRIPDGARITVDGDTGVVHLEE